jgi:hypothetical protein
MISPFPKLSVITVTLHPLGVFRVVPRAGISVCNMPVDFLEPVVSVTFLRAISAQGKSAMFAPYSSETELRLRLSRVTLVRRRNVLRYFFCVLSWYV